MVNCLFVEIDTGEIYILETDNAVNHMTDERTAVYYRNDETFVMSSCDFHRNFKPYIGGTNGDSQKC